ncbi:MAG: GNAT family N-acetyltransferase, partial [Nocardiopsaceae bacterium]|nr:GNAT family N-acetyltransferase [Nocardiopsaceae bacterium]
LTRVASVTTIFEWRGAFSNAEVNALHAQAFGTRVYDESEWDWVRLTQRHSLGWVVARQDGDLVGFVNVLWDGLVHAWLQDTMVATRSRGEGIGTGLVARAKNGAKAAGCEYLHVDFDEHLRPFYFDACGFTPTWAGLISLE